MSQTQHADSRGTSNPAKNRLSEALSDARVIVNHLASSGKLVDKQSVEPVLKAQEELNKGNISEPTEAAFWLCLSALAKAAHPVTVDGLRNSDQQDRRRLSLGRRTPRITVYYALAFSTLFALVVLQTYWFVGDSLVGSIKEAEAKLEPYSLAYRQAAAKLRGQLHRDPTDDEVAREVESGDIKESLDKRDLLVRSLRVNLSALARWNWISDSVIFRDLSLRSANPDVDLTKQYSYWEVGIADVKEIQTAQLVLDSLSRYILPIFYGFLGASTFIIRDLSIQLRELTYSFRSNAGYFLRFCLGGVTGLSVVWFLSVKSSTSPDTSGGAASLSTSLSPLALAFLAGYSVELLFTLLDRLVAAFTAPSQRQ